jgi:hypothetical protein
MAAPVQSRLFGKRPEEVEIEKIVLIALGDFQSRGKVLVGRQLAFDRLRGAFLRAFERFGLEELPDDMVANSLRRLGADVSEIPNFVAKHPYRVVVPEEVAQIARTYYSSFAQTKP